LKLTLCFSGDGAAKNARSAGNLFISELFRNSGRAKLPGVTKWILQRLEQRPRDKILVFAHHQDVLDGIHHVVHKSGYRVMRIDGKTPGDQRADLVKSFQEDPDTLVALLGITAAGVGITLTKASSVVFAELFWNPGQLQQAEDRAHRIGQTETVNVYYMVGKGTVDEVRQINGARKAVTQARYLVRFS